MAKKIGFIGLGIMGRPMALNLLSKGYHVTVNDINKDASITIGVFITFFTYALRIAVDGFDIFDI